MAKRSSSKLDSYLASVRRANAAAPTVRSTALDPAAYIPALDDAPAVSDAAAAAAADALVSPPVASPVARAYTSTSARTTLDVAGIGKVSVYLGADPMATAGNGVTIARYRRRSQTDPSRRWWIDGAIHPSHAGTLGAALERVHASEPAGAPRPVVATAPAPANDGAKRQRSTDPGLAAVLAIVADHARTMARNFEPTILAALRGGSIDPIAAWSAAAWLEGRAVTLFGAEHARAMAARDALRSACATFLRANAEAPARGVPVDLIMASIGGAS